MKSPLQPEAGPYHAYVIEIDKLEVLKNLEEEV